MLANMKMFDLGDEGAKQARASDPKDACISCKILTLTGLVKWNTEKLSEAKKDRTDSMFMDRFGWAGSMRLKVP